MKTPVSFFSLLLLFFSSLHPQQLYEKQIIPFDGLDGDWFGTEVAISDSFLFVSSLRYSNHIENAVYVYKFENNDYIFLQKIHPSDIQPDPGGALFGHRLLCKDGQLFVGARNKKVNNIPVGAVYVFEYEDETWVEKQIIIPPEPHSFNGNYSSSISKFDDYLFIGASRCNSGGYRSGKAFLYKYVNGEYDLYQEFAPSDAEEIQEYGYSVLIHDELVVIGSPLDNTISGLGSGSVYVYIKEDSIWTFRKKYLPELNSENFAYGVAVSTNGNYVFVGTSSNIYYYESGKVYIYKYSHPELDLTQIIETGDNYYNDSFGGGLFAKGDSLLVEAIYDTVKNENPGAAYLFVYERGEWNRRHKIFPSDEEDARWFSSGLTMTDNIIVIGAPLSTINGIRSGAVYLYTEKPLLVDYSNSINPKEFFISQNYPNPFNPTTRIDLYIPKQGEIKMRVYDITGREIKTLMEEMKYAGHYNVELDLSKMPSGVYFYRTEYVYKENNKNNRSVITKKAVFLK